MFQIQKYFGFIKYQCGSKKTIEEETWVHNDKSGHNLSWKMLKHGRTGNGSRGFPTGCDKVDVQQSTRLIRMAISYLATHRINLYYSLIGQSDRIFLK